MKLIVSTFLVYKVKKCLLKSVCSQLNIGNYKYIKLLREYGIIPSMTECGNPKDNAVAERVNNTLKNELFMGLSFTSLQEVEEALERAVHFYNELRPHGSIGMLTPKEAAKQKGSLKKNWTSYREKYIKSLPVQEKWLILQQNCKKRDPPLGVGPLSTSIRN